MRRVCDAIAVTVTLLVLSSSSAFAQASISGVVRDSSGAVLPGVTVEASSPDLIERVRSAVTDADGQYRIVDLRAGRYALTFSLPGFSTVRREGIELAGSFVATINAQLSVGQLQETVVVTGSSPLVDVQSVSRQTTMNNELINNIPAARSYGGLMTLMPNTVVQGGAASNAQVVPNMVVFGGAGGRTNEGRLQVDGLSVGTAFNGAGVSAYVADVNNAQEVVLTSSGGMGEAEAGGPTLNIVPKEGGNRISGQAYLAQVTEGMIGSNYTDELKARGLTTPGSYTKIWDYNVGIGGPIVRDRLWYFLQVRNEGYENTVPGMFANANAGNASKWFYVPDRSRPAAGAASFQTTALRLTSQLSQKNKLTVFWDEQVPCEGAAFGDAEGCRNSGDDRIICAGASPTPACSATTAPEAGAYRNVGQRVQQARWTSTVTSRMLAEAGLGTYSSHWGGKPMPGADSDLIRVQDQCLVGSGVPGAPCEHGIANLTYRSPNWGDNFALVLNWRASVSYVAGSHSLKVGYQGSHLGDNRLSYSNSSALSYRFNNGSPNQLTQTLNAFELMQRVRTAAFYAQDAWTMGRMTLLGALRYDRAWSYFPEQTVGPHVFFPTAKTYPYTKGSTYNDLSPRGGAAIDVFGNGKTSLKLNFGRYLEAAQNGGFFITNNPTGRLQTTSSRTWGDADQDFVPDCNLLDQNANGECGVGNRNFGTEVVSSTLDPTLVTGWGVRTGDWQWGAAVQQQVMPRVSAEVTYQRRWLMNFSATDNRNVAVSDYDAFSLNVPVDSRLPDGGGGQLSGLYNITAAANTRLTDNFVTLASRIGEYTQATDSVSLNVTARPRFGLTLQGGFNYARTNADACEIHNALPEYSVLGGIIGTTNPWCSTTNSLFRTTALGSYIVPKVDVQLGFTFRSDQGASLNANFTASPANTTLGRPFAGASSTITVNLVEPGTLYGDRVNQFDMRVAKVLRFGRTTTNVGVDVFNLLNASPVLTYNEAFTATWLRPNSVLQARFMKISAQIGF
ncbi:MAG TPA: carboxypeptidase-like regulatory domain-containing protein [Vicinamibacterales bacterium]|nr:carboxypeptidase-like regulatory domain-containing protein [Vicinamibacterales bacterium]